MERPSKGAAPVILGGAMNVRLQLIAHLKQCRQRTSYIAVLGLAAFLAWRALPEPTAAQDPLARAYAAERALFDDPSGIEALHGRLIQWAKSVPYKSIEQSALTAHSIRNKNFFPMSRSARTKDHSISLTG